MRKRRPILIGEISFFSLPLSKASLFETELSFVKVVVEIHWLNECFAFSSLLWY